MKKKNSNRVKKSIVKKLTHLRSSKIKSIAKQLDIETKGRLKEDLIDSISSVTSPEEINRFLAVEKTSKSKVGRLLAIIFSVITVLGVLLGVYADGPPFLRDFGRYFGIDPDDSNKIDLSHIAKTDVKILILPFRSYDDKEIDVGYLLHKRFENLKIETSSISSYYLEDYDLAANNRGEVARAVMDSLGFDMVVYGEYQTESCSSDNLVCLNYIASEDYRTSLGKYGDKTTHNLIPFSTPMILKGDIQGDIEYAVYRIRLIVDKYLGDQLNALMTSKYIVDSLSARRAIDLKNLFLSYVHADSVNQGENRLNDYLADHFFDTVDKSMLYYSLQIMFASIKKDKGKLDKHLLDLNKFLIEQNPPESVEIAKHYEFIGEFSSIIFPQSAIYYLLAANKIMLEKGGVQEQAKSYHDLSLGYYNLGNYTESLKALENALKLYQESIENYWLIIRCKELEVSNYIKLKKYDLSDEKMKEIMTMIGKTTSQYERVLSKMKFANEYASVNEYSRSNKLLKDALDECDNLIPVDYQTLIKFALYKNIGINYSYQDKPRKANRNFEDALTHLEEYLSSTSINENLCPTATQMFMIWSDLLEKHKKKDDSYNVRKEARKVLSDCIF